MRTLTTAFILMGLSSPAFATEGEAKDPTIQDLDFLIGEWAVTFEHYDPRDPESEVVISETGTLTCSYDLMFNDTPKYIVCEGVMDGSNGWKRTFKEYHEYNRLKKSFERVAVYSNWSGIGRDLILFDAEKRLLDVRGTLDVQNNMIERIQDYYWFNEDYTAYERRAVSNFSDMPVDQYNLVFNSSAKKVK